MAKRPIVALVGGGSVNWALRLCNDIMLKEELADADIRLLDIDRKAAERVARPLRMLAERRGIGATFTATDDEARALKGADSVIITISTGGLKAMAHDLAIPDEYGIYQTVGDTVGPGGWARGLRNIPVFVHLAEQIRRYAPGAFVLNYTNPMSTLTDVLCRLLDQPVVGLCHGVFANIRELMRVFKLKREDELTLRFAGVNHFFFILDFAVRGKAGYPLLRRRMRGKSFDDLIADTYVDAAGWSSRYKLVGELLREVGYLPYVGDRHTSEFLSGYLNATKRRMDDFSLVRTFVKDRQEKFKARGKELRKMAMHPEMLPGDTPSRETAADISAVKVAGGHIIDVVNLPNLGQVANLPLGAVVETQGVVTPSGFDPITVGPLPESVHSVVAPHAHNQLMIVDAALDGDVELALQALLNDPLCSHLPRSIAREMGMELLKAHAATLPRPFGDAKAMKF